MEFNTQLQVMNKVKNKVTKEEFIYMFNQLYKLSPIILNKKKGKGILLLETTKDYIIAKKPIKGDNEVKWITYKIEKKELSNLFVKIKLHFSVFPEKFVKSKVIGVSYYFKSWSKIFNDRKLHNKFTIMLNILEKQNKITYKRSGKIYLK